MKKELVLIAALSENETIGFNGKLPWHIPEDIKRFKEVTMGNSVVMGRKTYSSIGKPLQGRENIVLTRDSSYVSEGVIVANSISSAIEKSSREKVFFIGGREVYEESLPLVDRLELTRVEGFYEGDVFFPKIDYSKWLLESEMPREGFSFLTYGRK